MNVKELKEKIKDLPDRMEVMIPAVDLESIYTPLETAEVKSIRFHECEESEANCECEAVAYDDCLILDSEI